MGANVLEDGVPTLVGASVAMLYNVLPSPLGYANHAVPLASHDILDEVCEGFKLELDLRYEAYVYHTCISMY